MPKYRNLEKKQYIMKRIIALASAALILCACSDREKDYDATGTFEATETTVFAEQSGTLLSFDIFEGELFPLVMGEIEFESGNAAKAFDMKSVPFFKREVTYDKDYHNSNLAKNGLPPNFD